MLYNSDSNFLFLREVSKQKLERLVELAHNDPDLLIEAIQSGQFNNIRKIAIESLKTEAKKVQFNIIKADLERAIDLLNENI